MEKTQKSMLNISVRCFVTAIAVIFALMLAAYFLTLFIPGGEYTRTLDAAGNPVISSSADFTFVEGGIAFWKWLLSPILVLGADGSAMLIAVLIFLLVIGGAFTSLEKCGLLEYMLRSISARFSSSRYKLLAVVSLFFMSLGALIGSFEECVPMVPIVVGLAVSLGWDELTGLGMCLLATGCGFASGVCNPFTVGIAQQLAGLPMFSGIWLRFVGFVLIYALLSAFLFSHAKKVEKPLSELELAGFEKDPALEKGMRCFIITVGAGILCILLSALITALQDYTMIITALMFLAAGIAASSLSGLRGRQLFRTFLTGMKNLSPAVLMILMASSIKYTLTEARVLDTILHGAVTVAGTLPGWALILFIYLIVLVMNFFITSGSAKAFMLIPLIVPLAQIFGVSAQLSIVAFAFGDGFSNVIYPTSAALLIALGLVDVSYGDWFKWNIKFQLLNLLLTSGILLFGFFVGY